MDDFKEVENVRKLAPPVSPNSVDEEEKCQKEEQCDGVEHD